MLLERGDVRAPGARSAAGDDEVRAVPIAARLVLRPCGAARRRGAATSGSSACVAAQAGDHARDQQRHAVAAGVHHAVLAQHGQQLGTALDRCLGRLERLLEHLGEHLVLLLVGGVARRAAACCMCASSVATRCAISRTTVIIVPSAGSRTEE